MRTTSHYIPFPCIPVVFVNTEAAVPGSKSENLPNKQTSVLSLRSVGIWVAMLFVLLIMSSCKKDKQEEKENLVLGTCKPVALQGSLLYDPSTQEYTYVTRAGGKVVVTNSQHIKFTHSDYPGFEVSWWGTDNSGGLNRLVANHENLNGKHIKDREGSNRSFLFPDGTKITVTSGGELGSILTISIYEQEFAHHINYSCNTVEYSAANLSRARKLDEMQPDGETAQIEFTATGLLYLNIYSESIPGNKIEKKVPLGEINRSLPNQVRDYYDDPRLGHT